VTGPEHGFACWFWDYDNDGQLDLYVNDYTSSLAEFVAVSLKAPLKRSSRPRLYRNVGAGGFREVTREVGLDRVMMPMGCNFADIDNDGFLDVYLGTGRMALEVLVPNLMFKNEAGRRFEDVTMSSGTGHLQKGHGISFADYDCDGDLDLFVEAGGGVPGDKAYNVLFQNPGHGHHWLKVKLVGTKTNRAALGAQIKAVVQGADGTSRSIHRTVGNNGSFGGNSLVESIGLLEATSVAELHVTWPTSQTTQTFRDIDADQAIEITEGVDSFKPLPQPKLTVPQK
ncbi:MAG: CRTAC1 family protein, partial [Planctomycetota bacterium]